MNTIINIAPTEKSIAHAHDDQRRIRVYVRSRTATFVQDCGDKSVNDNIRDGHIWTFPGNDASVTLDAEATILFRVAVDDQHGRKTTARRLQLQSSAR